MFGSQFSCIIIAAVAPRAYRAHSSWSLPCAATASRTCPVMSTISSRDVVLNVMVVLMACHC
jgi:hypothetical protein